jgi:hypothetical protein
MDDNFKKVEPYSVDEGNSEYLRRRSLELDIKNVITMPRHQRLQWHG